MPKHSRKHFCFLLDWYAPCRIFNKRKHVLAKALFQKAALLDWSAPGVRVSGHLQIQYLYKLIGVLYSLINEIGGNFMKLIIPCFLRSTVKYNTN